MKDYYKILGVGEDASSEEIRDRYIELAKLHHPDAKESGLQDDRIKEINEAYGVLKDDATRLDYDLRRSVKRVYLKERNREKKWPWVFKGAALSIIVLLFFGFFLWRKSSVGVQDSSVVYHSIIPLQTQKPQPNASVKREATKSGQPASPGKPLETRPQIPSNQVQKPKPEPNPKEAPSKTSPVPTKEEPGSFQVHSMAPAQASEKIAISKPASAFDPPSLNPKEKPAPDPMVANNPDPASVVSNPEPPIPKKQEQPVASTLEPPATSKTEEPVRTIPEPVIPKVASPSPSPLVEDEVKQFLTDYIDRYTRKDIQEFLALFSPKAIQNGKDGLEKIRDIYLRFFEQSERLFYRLEDVKISIDGSDAEVKARYQVTQKLKNQRNEKLWRGSLRWELAKKEEMLKIVVLDYQHDKSP